ncbi:TIGR03087 family PEP-CTERM/XrtA system glycosyltransferase [Uliginosibacterium sp. sgz301328]|uniref:TIGR03087 family PEP-CTERM/XrtA system glycosyltransferase n=1 Tax=Uliginosibacterium sp. sgz301328 TaxID=3243764 RepID=UPI00359E4793
MKPALLYLVHRIPFPPNKGDKVRSHNLLRHLARNYRVFLGTFIDDDDDWQHVGALQAWCEEVEVIGLSPRLARLRSLAGLFGSEALSLPYYRSARLQAWVSRVMAEHDIRRVVVFSSSMAQYAPQADGVRCVVDFVDVDSAKWSRYADDHRGALAWLYRREGRRLAEFEAATARRADASVLVSDAEAELLRALVPDARTRIHGVSNGVDAEFFSPVQQLPDPYQPGTCAVVFTGAMDYWPNIDAVQWFVGEVWPRLRAQRDDLSFYIVGMNPAMSVKALDGRDGIVVTGRVPDVRPYLAHAVVAVAPLRLARGIQNKVLEAMAMARPVVVSPQAAIGIDAREGDEWLLASDVPAWLRQIGRVLDGHLPGLGPRARARVLAAYSWEANLARFDALIEGETVAFRQPAEVAL